MLISFNCLRTIDNAFVSLVHLIFYPFCLLHYYINKILSIFSLISIHISLSDNSCVNTGLFNIFSIYSCKSENSPIKIPV